MDQPLILLTFSRTPVWVYVVFLALVFLGLQQRRERTIRRSRLPLLPLAMLCFSLYGISTSFGISVLPYLAWTLGFLPVFVLGQRLLRPRGAVYSPTSRSFRVPGSWVPFILMMAIFWVKYATGFVLARHLAIIQQLWFVGTVSLTLGLLSGLFAARAAGVWLTATEALTHPDTRSIT